MTEDNRNLITAVIPAFNEEKTIAWVVEGVCRHVDKVVVVDDGSGDSTSLIAANSGASVIRIPRNGGKGLALSIGLSTAVFNGSDIIVCLDADGQHNPDDIPRIIQPIIDGRADMVIGSRFIDPQSKDTIPGYRRIGQNILTKATNFWSNVKITDSQSGYRAFTKAGLSVFDFSESGMGIESEMIRSAVENRLRIEEIPISARYEGLDTSTFRPTSHAMTVLGSIIRSIRSDHPLLYFGISGLIMTLVGVIVGLYSIQQYISSDALPFGPSLIAVMFTFLGVLFMLVGLILNAIGDLMKGYRSNWQNRKR